MNSQDQPSTFSEPKILLVDMPEECVTKLRQAGYNTPTGSFGTRIHVEKSDTAYVVPHNSVFKDISTLAEQDILILNLAVGPTKQHRLPITAGVNVRSRFQFANRGFVDPRPMFMSLLTATFDKIMQHGGLAVILTDSKYQVESNNGHFGNSTFFPGEFIMEDNWSCLSELSYFNTDNCNGTTVNFIAGSSSAVLPLSKIADTAHYTVSFTPHSWEEHNFTCIAKNKFGDCIAGVLSKDNATLLLLPQMPSLHLVITELVEKWCIETKPQLFPHHEGQRWLHSEKYELPQVKEILVELAEVRRQAAAHEKELLDQIEVLRTENSDWYTMLNGTGGKLVQAVIKTLRFLGFQDVIDVDEKEKAAGNVNQLKEDVQILDGELALITDIKGVIGKPEDSEVTQAEKHALMRSKEFNGKVKPLTIINHERNRPPHLRTDKPFRPEIIENAQMTNLGLMTTWDLFQLARHKQLLGWPNEVIAPIFYRSGHIEPIPEHYHELGTILRKWDHSIGVIPNKVVHIGMHLAVLADDQFHEIAIDSIQVDGVSCNEAPIGSNCGIKCDTALFREKMRVFLF